MREYVVSAVLELCTLCAESMYTALKMSISKNLRMQKS